MAFQGEYFVDLYGKEAAKRTPPIHRMLTWVYLLAPVVMQRGFPAITLELLFTGWLQEKPLVVFRYTDEKMNLIEK